MIYANIKFYPEQKNGIYGIFAQEESPLGVQEENSDPLLLVGDETIRRISGKKNHLSIEIIDGKPVIVPKDDDDLYLIMSTEKKFSKKKHGIFCYRRTQNIKFINKQPGTNKIYIIKAKNKDFFRIIWANGSPDTYYFVENNGVISINEYEGVEKMIKEMGITIPIHPRSNERYKLNDWQYI